MPIESSELVAYASAGRPEDDTAASGGAIDEEMRVSFTQLTSNDTLRVWSSSAYDVSQTVTVRGRNAAGELVECTAALDGVALVPLSPTTTFERVIDCVVDNPCIGEVTLERASNGVDVGIIAAGETGFTMLFIGSFSESSQTVRHEKIFLKNTNGALTATQAKVRSTADPAGKIRIGLEASKDGSGSIANRKAVPGGISFSQENVDLDVPGTVLEAGEAIGCWVEQTLSAADSPVRSSFTVRLSCISA